MILTIFINIFYRGHNIMNNEKKDTEYEISNYYREIAYKLKTKYKESIGHVNLDKVVFLENLTKSPAYKFACTKKASKEERVFNENKTKFYIIFYKKNMDGLTDNQKAMVCYHELLHIDFDNENIVRHDVEDFNFLLKKYGINYLEENLDIL